MAAYNGLCRTRWSREIGAAVDALVLQSDFGVADGAVSAMYGVALGISPDLRICDLTHEIPQYDIWEASYRLIQTISYWPVGTVSLWAVKSLTAELWYLIILRRMSMPAVPAVGAAPSPFAVIFWKS